MARIAASCAIAPTSWPSKLFARPDDPFDTAQLTESDVESSPGKLEEELSALSMMGGRRLVRLRLTGEKAGPDKATAEALTRHVEGQLNPDAFFLVEAGALGRDSALRKVGEKAGGCAVIPCYEDEAGDMARLARETLAKDKVSLNSEALDLFVSRLPKERGVARMEIERLALFLGPGSGANATAADLTDFLGVEPEASLSDAAADAFGGRLGPAQAGLRRAAAEGEGGPAAVRAMGYYLGRLRRTLTLHKNGIDLVGRPPRPRACSGNRSASSCARPGPGTWRSCWTSRARSSTPTRPARRRVRPTS
jgi:DNA polymerase-3 subunit delta